LILTGEGWSIKMQDKIDSESYGFINGV